MNRKRVIVYVLLALAVPLPALALQRDPANADLGVQASLDGCWIADAEVMCRIDASFSRIAGADYYTASATAPDGAASDMGMIAGGGEGAGSAEVWVPYAGNGTYTIAISAWGYDEKGRADVVDSDHAGADGGAAEPEKRGAGAAGPPNDSEGGGGEGPGATEPPTDGDEPCDEVAPDPPEAGVPPATEPTPRGEDVPEPCDATEQEVLDGEAGALQDPVP